MKIRTKSIQHGISPTDGIRICIMRRIKPEFIFDIWIPKLSPSTELLQKYQAEEISWGEFSKSFKRELGKNKKYLKIVSDIVEKNRVTLLCWEESGNRCHRSIVAKELQKY